MRLTEKSKLKSGSFLEVKFHIPLACGLMGKKITKLERWLGI